MKKKRTLWQNPQEAVSKIQQKRSQGMNTDEGKKMANEEKEMGALEKELLELQNQVQTYYLEHPEKRSEYPDKIFVKSVEELEEKITEHIPKRVVEDEIVEKRIVDKTIAVGESPMDFSLMNEIGMPKQYVNSVFQADEEDADEDVDDKRQRKSEHTGDQGGEDGTGLSDSLKEYFEQFTMGGAGDQSDGKGIRNNQEDGVMPGPGNGPGQDGAVLGMGGGPGTGMGAKESELSEPAEKAEDSSVKTMWKNRVFTGGGIDAGGFGQDEMFGQGSAGGGQSSDLGEDADELFRRLLQENSVDWSIMGDEDTSLPHQSIPQPEMPAAEESAVPKTGDSDSKMPGAGSPQIKVLDSAESFDIDYEKSGHNSTDSQKQAQQGEYYNNRVFSVKWEETDDQTSEQGDFAPMVEYYSQNSNDSGDKQSAISHNNDKDQEQKSPGDQTAEGGKDESGQLKGTGESPDIETKIVKARRSDKAKTIIRKPSRDGQESQGQVEESGTATEPSGQSTGKRASQVSEETIEELYSDKSGQAEGVSLESSDSGVTTNGEIQSGQVEEEDISLESMLGAFGGDTAGGGADADRLGNALASQVQREVSLESARGEGIDGSGETAAVNGDNQGDWAEEEDILLESTLGSLGGSMAGVEGEKKNLEDVSVSKRQDGQQEIQTSVSQPHGTDSKNLELLFSVESSIQVEEEGQFDQRQSSKAKTENTAPENGTKLTKREKREQRRQRMVERMIQKEGALSSTPIVEDQFFDHGAKEASERKEAESSIEVSQDNGIEENAGALLSSPLETASSSTKESIKPDDMQGKERGQASSAGNDNNLKPKTSVRSNELSQSLQNTKGIVGEARQDASGGDFRKEPSVRKAMRNRGNEFTLGKGIDKSVQSNKRQDEDAGSRNKKGFSAEVRAERVRKVLQKERKADTMQNGGSTGSGIRVEEKREAESRVSVDPEKARRQEMERAIQEKLNAKKTQKELQAEQERNQEAEMFAEQLRMLLQPPNQSAQPARAKEVTKPVKEVNTENSPNIKKVTEMKSSSSRDIRDKGENVAEEPQKPLPKDKPTKDENVGKDLTEKEVPIPTSAVTGIKSETESASTGNIASGPIISPGAVSDAVTSSEPPSLVTLLSGTPLEVDEPAGAAQIAGGAPDTPVEVATAKADVKTEGSETPSKKLSKREKQRLREQERKKMKQEQAEKKIVPVAGEQIPQIDIEKLEKGIKLDSNETIKTAVAQATEETVANADNTSGTLFESANSSSLGGNGGSTKQLSKREKQRLRKLEKQKIKQERTEKEKISVAGESVPVAGERVPAEDKKGPDQEKRALENPPAEVKGIQKKEKKPSFWKRLVEKISNLFRPSKKVQPPEKAPGIESFETHCDISVEDGIVNSLEGVVEGAVRGESIILELHSVIKSDVVVTDCFYCKQKSNVFGNVFAKKAIIEGTVTGDVKASQSIEIKAGGCVLGNVYAPSISIDVKGYVAGDLTYEKGEVK